MPAPETLTVAVCICDGVTLSDFIPNIEILAGLNGADLNPFFAKGLGEVPFRLKFAYLAPTLAPVVSACGDSAPTVNPTTTYAAALASGEQYDIIWVPAGGFGYLELMPYKFSFKNICSPTCAVGPMPDFESGEHKVPEDLIPFISTQAPKAKYTLSVCGGAVYLAFAGLLSGKRATTNKAFYRAVVVRSSFLFHKGSTSTSI
jgi:putative intracellular protease/amidase